MSLGRWTAFIGWEFVLRSSSAGRSVFLCWVLFLPVTIKLHHHFFLSWWSNWWCLVLLWFFLSQSSIELLLCKRKSSLSQSVVVFDVADRHWCSIQIHIYALLTNCWQTVPLKHVIRWHEEIKKRGKTNLCDFYHILDNFVFLYLLCDVDHSDHIWEI